MLLHFKCYTCRTISPRKGKEEEIQRFHSTDFIEFLHRINSVSDEEKVNTEEAELYGLCEYFLDDEYEYRNSNMTSS